MTVLTFSPCRHVTLSPCHPVTLSAKQGDPHASHREGGCLTREFEFAGAADGVSRFKTGVTMAGSSSFHRCMFAVQCVQCSAMQCNAASRGCVQLCNVATGHG